MTEQRRPRKDQTMDEILIASTNPHKADEFRTVLAPLGIRVLSLADVPGARSIAEPDEDADTLAGNAEIKARHYARALDRIALADDSGLIVDALGGAPGVRSARYAGIGNTRDERDRANNDKLLRALRGVPRAQRTARFACALALAAPDGSILASAEGTFQGHIAETPRGDNGFGYDPLLILEDGRTAAELTPVEKARVSHRGKAARQLAGTLARRPPRQ